MKKQQKAKLSLDRTTLLQMSRVVGGVYTTGHCSGTCTCASWACDTDATCWSVVGCNSVGANLC
jgi:hypothetical protein